MSVTAIDESQVVRDLLPAALISDLKSRDAPDEAKTCQVVGYAAAGDGGADLFWWDADSTDTDDSTAGIGLVTTVLPTGHTGAGRWKRLRPLSSEAASIAPRSSVAALKALPVAALTANMTVTVLGYYTAGDGGGGEFYWDSASSATDNGGTVIAPDAGGVGRWRRVYSGRVNAKWFGLKGDGVDDETAMDNLTAFTKSFFLPNGTYATDLVMVGSGWDVEGESAQNTIIKPKAAHTTGVKLAGTYTGSLPNITVSAYGINNKLRRLTIDMANMTNATTTYGLNIVASYNNYIEGIYVKNNGASTRTLRVDTATYTTEYHSCDFASTTGIVELIGYSLANAVTTQDFYSSEFAKMIVSYGVNINVLGGAAQGSQNKFDLSQIQGMNILGVDVEGTGTYLVIGTNVNHLRTANEMSGFSGTYSSGTAVSYAFGDFHGSQPIELVGTAAGLRVIDTPTTLRKTTAGLHRTVVENTNAAASQVDFEYKNTAAGGSAYVGQTSAGKAFLDGRGGGGAALQVGGVDRVLANATGLGFYNVTPVARPAAYTQTYATATRTHANLTSSTLTDNTAGTANTTLEALADGTTYANDVAAIRNNFADLAAQCNALRVDLENAKQVINQVIDDDQSQGLKQ